MAIPPLNVGIIGPGKGGVRLGERHRDAGIIHQIEDSDPHQGGDDVPEGDIHLLLFALHDGHEDIHRKDNPEDYHENIDGPLQLGVLLGLVIPHEEGYRRQDDDQIEEPELEPGQTQAPDGGLGQSLGYVIEHPHEAPDTPAEDGGVGVERTETAVGQKRREIELRKDQLERDEHSNQHRHQPPDDAPEEKTLGYLIGVSCFYTHDNLLAA